MRFVSAFLFVLLTASVGLADDAKPSESKPEVTKKKVPLRVVKILPETGQVLLFDKTHGTHVVAEVGQAVEGYVVDDIDEDEVTLTSDTGVQVILAAPPPPKKPAKKADKQAPAPADPYAPADATAPADPYADAAKAPADGTAPVDPYGPDEVAPTEAGEGGVRVASAGSSTAKPPTAGTSAAAAPSAPSDPYGDPGIAAFAAAVGATPAPLPDGTTPRVVSAKDAKPTKGKAKTPAKGGKATKGAAKGASTTTDGASLAAAATGSADASLSTTDVAPAAPAAAAPNGTTVIARNEVDAALANFGKLAASFRATFTADGLRIDTLADGTILGKIGLQKGDVITSVDNQPLKSLDDAANLYARAGSVKATTIKVVRDGKPVTLRVTIN